MRSHLRSSCPFSRHLNERGTSFNGVRRQQKKEKPSQRFPLQHGESTQQSPLLATQQEPLRHWPPGLPSDSWQGQTIPHPPQLFGSVSKFVSQLLSTLPSQFAKLAGQALDTQCPKVQVPVSN